MNRVRYWTNETQFIAIALLAVLAIATPISSADPQGQLDDASLLGMTPTSTGLAATALRDLPTSGPCKAFYFDPKDSTLDRITHAMCSLLISGRRSLRIRGETIHDLSLLSRVRSDFHIRMVRGISAEQRHMQSYIAQLSIGIPNGPSKYLIHQHSHTDADFCCDD